MTHEHDKEACAVSFEELRKRALDEFKEGVGTYPADAAWALERQLKKIDAAEKAAQERDEAARIATEARHDSAAIGQLYGKMHAKLAETRKNRGGWWTDGCTVEKLSQMLHAVVAKGDPVDVANYCAFIAAKGGKIAPISTATAIGIRESAERPAGQDMADAMALTRLVPVSLTERATDTTEAVNVPEPIGRLVPRKVDLTPYELRGAMETAKAELASAAREDLARKTLARDGSSLLRPATTAAQLIGAAEFAGELNKARAKFPTMASAHEGFAIIAEEMDELKAIVWQKQSERDYAAMRKETIQLGAMVLAFLLEVVNPENRR